LLGGRIDPEDAAADEAAGAAAGAGFGGGFDAGFSGSSVRLRGASGSGTN